MPQLIAGVSGGATVVINTEVQGGRTQAIDFTGLAPVTDTVTEATFTILGTAGADTITITDGGIVGGDQTWLISSPTFESVRVSNKTTLIIDGNGGGDTVSMDTSVQMTGLLSLQIRGVASVSETGAFDVSNLTIDATGSVTLTNLNEVDDFRAHVTDAGSTVQFHNTDDFSVNGITTGGGAVQLAADTGDIFIGTANSGINVGSLGTVTLQATTGDVRQFANGAINAGFIGVFAGDFVLMTAAINNTAAIAIAANGTVDYRDADSVLISAISASGLLTSNVFGISSNNNPINLQVGGDLTLNPSIGAAIDAGTHDLRIVAGGAVTQGDAGDQIIANELGIIAGGPVMLARRQRDQQAGGLHRPVSWNSAIPPAI